MTRFGRVMAVMAVMVLVGAVAACDPGPGGGDPPVQAASRSDSAGTTIVSTPGPDRPLAWEAREVVRIGPADAGPEAFFRVDGDGSGLAADEAGNVYVLDTGHRQVRVFDREGGHLRTLGGPGEGPGELTNPTRLFVTGDGVVAVADARKRALVRFAPDGALLPGITMRDRPLGSSELRGYAGDALVFTVDEPYATLEEAVARTPRTSRLTRLPLDIGERAASPADSGVVLASWTETPNPGVRIEACDATVSFTPPLKPSQLVAGTGEWIAWAVGPEYVVEVAAAGGARTSVRRALPAVAATPELAARDFATISIELASHEMCEITGERAVEAAGLPEVVPWLTGLRIAPDGSLFVQRRDPADLPTRRIDVFTPDGAYAGTLPETFPLPAAFTGPDTFLRVERDALDVPMVIVYRIVR